MDGGAAETGIGRPVKRREDLRLLTGRGRYSDDLNLPGQAYAVMVRSPHAHALIRRIDTDAARARAGGAGGADRRRAARRRAEPAAEHRQQPSGRYQHQEQGRLSGNPPGTAGDRRPRNLPCRRDRRRRGRDLACRWRRTQPNSSGSITSHCRRSRTASPPPNRDAPRARQDSPNVILDGEVGDPAATEAAFAGAAHVVRFETWVQRIAGVPMEPRAAIGEYDAATGRYTLHAGAGGAVSPRRDLALVLGVPPEQARVVMHDVGGNFGTRGGFNPEFAIVAWAARRVGRPVKWTGDRSEYFSSDHQARDLAVTAELALDKDGTFLAMRGSNLVNQGAYALAFGSLNKGVEIMSSIYHVPSVFFRARAALTNTAPTRPYRSSGRPEVMFVMERLIDLAARQTGIDRIELRRRNLVPESMMPYTNPFGMVYDSGAYHRVMERVLELADWDGFPARREAARERGKMPRHRRRELCRYRDRRAARAGRDHRQTARATARSRWSSAPCRRARGMRRALRSSSPNGSAYRSTACAS